MILASVFRDSEAYLDRYVAQVEALRETMPVYVVAVEGDSDDNTWKALQDTDFYCLKVEHGGPRYGSVDHPVRWRQIAAACQVAMIAATRLCEPNDPFCYVESDLLWEPETMVTLVDDLSRVPAVAPLSMIRQEDDGQLRFYDGYGYRKDGISFGFYPPYFDGYDPEALRPIDSSGSCFATLGHYMPMLNFSPTACITGIGQSLRDNGYNLFLDPTVMVVHPS